MTTTPKNNLKHFPAMNREITGVFRQLLMFVCLMIPCFFPTKAVGFDTSQDTWALLAGYGQSFPGWGQTTQRVKTIDFTPRYSHVIFSDLGSSWYRGNHAILLEAPVSYVASPESSAMIALNFLAAYNFTADPTYQPYIFGGGGPVYSFADIPGMGSELNGNYQFGLGLKYNSTTRHDLLFELRYHHISNGGSEKPNDPLNSLKFMVGVTF
ncbi:MAG: acyloxyacyl hydrolase [Desulfocapsaceae bacterium]|nr:acyloxyacyl hydrolase [Desulfocapsaceae bacterium]